MWITYQSVVVLLFVVDNIGEGDEADEQIGNVREGKEFGHSWSSRKERPSTNDLSPMADAGGDACGGHWPLTAQPSTNCLCECEWIHTGN